MHISCIFLAFHQFKQDFYTQSSSWFRFLYLFNICLVYVQFIYVRTGICIQSTFICSLDMLICPNGYGQDSGKIAIIAIDVIYFLLLCTVNLMGLSSEMEEGMKVVSVHRSPFKQWTAQDKYFIIKGTVSNLCTFNIFSAYLTFGLSRVKKV